MAPLFFSDASFAPLAKDSRGDRWTSGLSCVLVLTGVVAITGAYMFKCLIDGPYLSVGAIALLSRWSGIGVGTIPKNLCDRVYWNSGY